MIDCSIDFDSDALLIDCYVDNIGEYDSDPLQVYIVEFLVEATGVAHRPPFVGPEIKYVIIIIIIIIIIVVVSVMFIMVMIRIVS